VNTSRSIPPTFCFGAFELDPRAGELRKKGMKIKLQGQPAEILVMLLERPGETVTREELQKKLWAADTFVDFEQGLNNAMNRLRVALDDDAESPHFIETVPRRGYRFVGVLNGGGQPVAAGAVPPASKIAWRPRFSWSVCIWLAVIGMAGLVLLISAVYRPRSPLRQTPRVSRYSKLTNDPLPTTQCPLCGALPENQLHDSACDGNVTAVTAAAAAEIAHPGPECRTRQRVAAWRQARSRGRFDRDGLCHRPRASALAVCIAKWGCAGR